MSSIQNSSSNLKKLQKRKEDAEKLLLQIQKLNNTLKEKNEQQQDSLEIDSILSNN